VLPERRRPRDWTVALRGVLIGTADLVPGVSGGTMALLTGIYRRLIDALSALTGARLWSAIRARRWVEAWGAVDGRFLAALAVGIALALISLPRLLTTLLETRPVSVYAVFFGLIAASARVVARRIDGPRRVAWTTGAIGAVGAFVLVGLVPTTTPDAPWMFALAGAVAVSALLLPGVSGAFVLVLLGKYETVLSALAALDLVRLAPFAAGMAVGLLGFSRVLAAALHRWPTAILGLLAGFLVGSLRRVWPWRGGDAYTGGPALPAGSGEAVAIAALAVVAAVAVLAIERLAEGRVDRPDAR
jgi:putative membrane protein